MSSSSTNLTIGGYPFVCVPLRNADFTNIAAIYMVLCVKADHSWDVVDVGQSGEVGTRIDQHSRKTCWSHNCQTSNIWVCIHRMPSSEYAEADRLARERELRQMYHPPCGER